LFLGLEAAVERCFGDLEGVTDFRYGMLFVLIQLLGNGELFGGEGLRPAAFSSSCSGSAESCLGSLFNEISLKFRKCAIVRHEKGVGKSYYGAALVLGA
jgi:hypothetical protein